MSEIYPLNEDYLDSVCRLEKLLFSDPWSEDALRDYLLTPHARGYVLLDEGEVCAYGLFQSLLGEGEVLRIGTQPEKLRRGFANALLSHFFHEGKCEQMETVFLEVRSENTAARRLYEKVGFEICGTRKRYYQNPTDDAILYQKNLNET